MHKDIFLAVWPKIWQVGKSNEKLLNEFTCHRCKLNVT